jgi:hypothetical protein
MFTSAGNSLWLLEAQNVHDMAIPPKFHHSKCSDGSLLLIVVPVSPPLGIKDLAAS